MNQVIVMMGKLKEVCTQEHRRDLWIISYLICSMSALIFSKCEWRYVKPHVQPLQPPIASSSRTPSSALEPSAGSIHHSNHTSQQLDRLKSSPKESLHQDLLQLPRPSLNPPLKQSALIKALEHRIPQVQASPSKHKDHKLEVHTPKKLKINQATSKPQAARTGSKIETVKVQSIRLSDSHRKGSKHTFSGRSKVRADLVVRNLKLPQKMYLHWVHKGHTQLLDSLNIKLSPRAQAHSTLSLAQYSDHRGVWQVKIYDKKGKLLAETSFKVL